MFMMNAFCICFVKSGIWMLRKSSNEKQSFVHHGPQILLIFAGVCAEYSFGGNAIQQNYKAKCIQFSQSPCPNGYPSTDAYKCK